MNRIISHYQKGFTIVETLVAVAILMIAIAGPLTVAHNGLLASVTARDRLVASYLAQDAMEYIKAVRDENVSSGETNWLFEIANAPLTSCNDISDQCTVDTLTGLFSSGNPQVYTSTDGRYTHQVSGNRFSGFLRYYTYERYTDDYGRVTMYVTWNNGTLTNEVVVTSSLYKISR